MKEHMNRKAALVLFLSVTIAESFDYLAPIGDSYGNLTTIASKQPKYFQIWSDHNGEYASCCKVKKEDKETVKCLPSFVIAGVQKSGTTALAALLSSNDQISFSPKKEVHFFDNTENYQLGINKYLESFNPWNQLSPPLFGESTPFYVASREACQRISETIPNMKMIILLREPVSRAYSEYQMKKRCIQFDNIIFTENRPTISNLSPLDDHDLIYLQRLYDYLK